jgi:hypothetical protein
MLLLAAVAVLSAALLLSLKLTLPLAERLVRVVEKRIELAEHQVEARERREPIPVDLLQSVFKWSDRWAQEDQLKLFYERYDELGDWDRVRASLVALDVTEDAAEN